MIGEVEDGVPVSDDQPAKNYRGQYPFPALRTPNDSFLVAFTAQDARTARIQIYASARAYNQRWSPDEPIKIRTEGCPEGIRVVRVN